MFFTLGSSGSQDLLQICLQCCTLCRTRSWRHQMYDVILQLRPRTVQHEGGNQISWTENHVRFRGDSNIIFYKAHCHIRFCNAYFWPISNQSTKFQKVHTTASGPWYLGAWYSMFWLFWLSQITKDKLQKNKPQMCVLVLAGPTLLRT